jgi:hypothetical protein
VKSLRILLTGIVFSQLLLLSACVGPPLVLEPENLPVAIETQLYSVDLFTGEDVAEWSVYSGEIPPGLFLDPASGIIAGRPTVPGVYDFTIEAVHDALPRRTGRRLYSITVLERLRVEFTPPTARSGAFYTYTPQIQGGVPPYGVNVVGLPAGLDYDRNTGRIFGTPLNPALALRFDLTVRDSGPVQQTASDTAIVGIQPPGVEITTGPNLPVAPAGAGYLAALQARDGTPPYAWIVEQGVLPVGLRLNRLTGFIFGEPNSALAQTRTVTISVTDVGIPASQDTAEFKIVVPVRVLTVTLPVAPIGQPYSQTLQAANGLPPYQWSVTAGQLPAGLVLDPATGTISGTPTAGATSQLVTFRVMDNDNPPTQDDQQIAFLVSP